jgi:cellulose synthase/poly-beta-1,6-N-acetylglucosamine synthase-like glycosyltransferase
MDQSPHRLPVSRPATGMWDVVAVVPARNEEELISSTIESIVDAIHDASSRVARYSIVVVADRCVDGTADVARAALGLHPLSTVTECFDANVARARSIGVATARMKLGQVMAARTWIANTDADTVVPHDWISRQLCAADTGVEALAGIIDIDDFPGLPPQAAVHFDRSYTRLLPTVGDHQHVHGANMGLRLDVYDRAGGWGKLSRSEDRDLWTRLQRIGARTVAPTDLRVVTSGRSVGRVAGGFADFFREELTSLGVQSDANGSVFETPWEQIA